MVIPNLTRTAENPAPPWMHAVANPKRRSSGGPGCGDGCRVGTAFHRTAAVHILKPRAWLLLKQMGGPVPPTLMLPST